MRVFFFGVNRVWPGWRTSGSAPAGSAGMDSVRFLNPGFGSVEQKGSDAIIGAINAAEPDFLMIALGATKGQAWIQQNRQRLNARVISYLEVVVNFSAGNIRRSPAWLQQLGLEWLWRIKEEPLLWRRYLGDGLAFLGLVVQEVLPLWLYRSWRRPAQAPFRQAGVQVRRSRAGTRVSLSGVWGRATGNNWAPPGSRWWTQRGRLSLIWAA